MILRNVQRRPVRTLTSVVGIAFAGALMVVGLLAGPAAADVTVDKMFSDHMVLQRDMAVPVWGMAAPGEKVTVAFGDQKKTAEADKDGKWLVRLDAMKVGEPGKMTVSGGTGPIVFDDVLVGEVWLGSGQSNMSYGTRYFTKRDPVLKAMADGAPLVQQVRLVPLREGRLFLNVAASVEVEGGKVSTVAAIPVQVGAAPRQPVGNGTVTTDENGEAVHSLPADEN